MNTEGKGVRQEHKVESSCVPLWFAAVVSVFPALIAKLGNDMCLCMFRQRNHQTIVNCSVISVQFIGFKSLRLIKLEESINMASGKILSHNAQIGNIFNPSALVPSLSLVSNVLPGPKWVVLNKSLNHRATMTPTHHGHYAIILLNGSKYDLSNAQTFPEDNLWLTVYITPYLRCLV